MQVTKVISWLSKSLFQQSELGNPIFLEIKAYEEEQGEKGLNRRITGKHTNGRSYSFDIYGDTLNLLIDELGGDSDKWMGRKISVMLVNSAGKEKKIVKILP